MSTGDWDNGRDRDRDRDGSRRREEKPYVDQQSTISIPMKALDVYPVAATSSPVAVEVSEPFGFNFNAVQVVNRFLEVFAKTSKFRLDEIEETFAETAVISSLKNGKELISGKAKIRQSFTLSVSHECSATRRIFIECGNGASFAFDLHKIEASPGLGDPKKETVLLYRVSDSVITNVWGCVDKKNMASAAVLTLDDIVASEMWPLILPLVQKDEPTFSVEQCHFHDYTNIALWG